MGLISSKKSLALDTNIFIASYDPKNVHHTGSIALLHNIAESHPQVFISVLVFEEFLIRIYKEGLDKDLAHYENFLTGNGLFTIIDFDRQIARKAAQIRARHSSIRTPDAIHLASAIESGANLFITTDKRIPEKIDKLNTFLLR